MCEKQFLTQAIFEAIPDLRDSTLRRCISGVEGVLLECVCLSAVCLGICSFRSASFKQVSSGGNVGVTAGLQVKNLQ